jgi:hypothetical protein
MPLPAADVGGIAWFGRPLAEKKELTRVVKTEFEITENLKHTYSRGRV